MQLQTAEIILGDFASHLTEQDIAPLTISGGIHPTSRSRTEQP